MNPTSDDFKPRRDGWYEHRGTWAEVTVGTVLAKTGSRTQRWEVTDQAMGTQVRDGHTLWMRIREQTTGEEHTVKPRAKNSAAIILTQDPRDTQTAPPTPPSDVEAVLLVIEKLGATHLATRNEVTGEITCVDYDKGDEIGNGARTRARLDHLRLAHGVDTTEVEALDWQEAIVEIGRLHGRLHGPTPPATSGGFPHRHLPEDPYGLFV